MARLREQADVLRQASRDAQAAGDRLYWPIYNLNLKNPNTTAEESHDLLAPRCHVAMVRVSLSNTSAMASADKP